MRETRRRAGEAQGGEPGRIGEILLRRGLLRAEDLERALAIQRQSGERLGRVLVALGMVRRLDLFKALAEQWGYPFVDLLQADLDPNLAHRLAGEVYLREQFFPLRLEAGRLHVAVSRRPEEDLGRLLAEHFPAEAIVYYVTTDWDIDQAVRRLFRQEVLDSATYGLLFRHPEESAHTVFTPGQFAGLAVMLLGGLLALYLWPRPVLIALNLLVNLAFLASIGFRFLLTLVGAGFERWEPVAEEEVAALKEQDLPRYTILVPAYREANVVGVLLDNLGRLDYPPAKLEVLLLLEEDDEETVAAAKAASPPGHVDILIVPDGEPKTKPKACNVGLYFANGDYLVIYDAEDRPEPDQLKKAVVAFRKGPPNLACVQAALNYFNAEENFLTRMFTLEYSYWFDYLLPGLDRLGLPIPLGGTSNHFRTDVLRELGGWDPFNVTEDADLGVRAAARGYVVGVINSTTYEEANPRVGNWIRQRSRWIKGYMQTALVHLRRPLHLLHTLGLRATLAFLLLVGGTPLTFLSAPVLWALFLYWLLTRSHALEPYFPAPVLYVSLFNLLLGNGLAIYFNMLAVFKRRKFHLLPLTLLNPVYWFLHSIAAYKALFQLFTRPFYWEKTLHGLSKELARADSMA